MRRVMVLVSLMGLLLAGAPATIGAVSATEATAADPQSEALLEMIERFVDRSEDFWDGETFAAAGPGVSQPRGLGNVALTYATLLVARPDQHFFGEELHPRQVLLDHAEAAIRNAAETNVSEGGDWGGPGGHHWQASLETYGWGLAAYMLRDQLSQETLDVAGRVIRFQADALVDQPASDYRTGNTGAEDNGWNTPTPALAAGWWPEHANAEAWRRTAKRMAVNSATAPGDRDDNDTMIDGRPLSDWATTANLLSDLTMENHGRFNPIYQQVAPFNVGEAILINLMTGQAVPEAFEFRTELIYDRILGPLVTPDGDLLMTHGQDWVAKDYQHLGYLTLLGTWFQRPDATEYAHRAGRLIAARQAAREDGAFLGQDELGYESMLAKRMSAAYLLHERAGPAAEADGTGLGTIEAGREGTHLFPASKFVVHRTDGTLRSANWTNQRPMALLVPDGTLHPDDRVLVHYRTGSLIGSDAAGISATSCECRDDGFAVAEIVGGRGYAVASLPNGLMAALEAGTGHTFPVTLERIDGVTGPRPVVGPHGEIEGTQQVPWANIANRIGMVVEGGAGIRVDRAASTGPNSTDRVIGSVAGGDGQRAAVFYPDRTTSEMDALAQDVARAGAPDGWQGVQAPAPDGTIGILAARFGGDQTATVTLQGGPVITEPVVVDGDQTRWTLTLDDVAARARVAHATVSSTAPVTAWSPQPDRVFLRNDGTDDVDLRIGFTTGQEFEGTIGANEAAVAIIDDGQVLFGHTALAILVDARAEDPNEATRRHVDKAIEALVADDLEEALDQTLMAVRNSDGSIREMLSEAAASIAGLRLDLPDRSEVVRGLPTEVAASIVYEPSGWRAASEAEVTVDSTWADRPATASQRALEPGEELTATTTVNAGQADDRTTVEAVAKVTLGPTELKWRREGELVAVDPLELTLSQEGVAVGGSLSRTAVLDIESRVPHELDLDVTVAAPEGLSATASPPTVTVPASGEATTEITLSRDGIDDGRHEIVITVGNDWPTASLTVPVHTSWDLALNPFADGPPTASASSSQGPYPPSFANDGDDGTFWVSSGLEVGEGPSPEDPEIWTVEFGGTTQVGAVTVKPRVGFGPKEFTIEGRVDGTWQELADVRQGNGTEEHTVPETDVDALRLVITAAYDRFTPSRNVQIVAVEVSQDQPPVNVAEGAAVTASTSQPDYGPENAVDGTYSTFWVSGDPATIDDPQWVALDLGREVDLERLEVAPRPRYGPRHVVWQIGDGSGTWTDVAEHDVPERSSAGVDVDVRTRYLRLVATDGWDPRNVQITEIEAYAPQ